jgi:hypothetical protein
MELAGLRDDAHIEPAASPDSGSRFDWATLSLYYASGRRPIEVLRISDGPQLREELDEIDASLATQQRVTTAMRERIRSSKQMFTLTFAPPLDEDTWEILDMAEAAIASEFDGWVLADDGLFDARLQPIVRFPQ